MRLLQRVGLVRVTVAIGVALGASMSAAQDRPVKLFGPASDPAGARMAAAPSKPTRGVARQRFVTIDQLALEKGVAPRGLDRAADRLQRIPRNTPPISLELFPGKSGTFRKQDVQKATAGGYIWTGEQNEGDSATLVVNDDKVTGHVELDGSIFKIEPAGGPVHRVIEIEPRALPKDGPHLKPPAPKRQSRQSAPSGTEPSSAPTSGSTGGTTVAEPTIAGAGTTNTIVDLLVAYTASGARQSPNILADIDLAVALTNRAFVNSSIAVRIRLRGTLLVPGYNELNYPYTTTLEHLTGVNGEHTTLTGKSAFAPVRNLRNKIGADLVALMRAEGEYCGQAWLNESPGAPDSAAWAYSQTSLDCIPAFVMAHELGHNMGLNHDRYAHVTFDDPGSANPAPSKYNFGFVNVSRRMRDIMSYASKCMDQSVYNCALKNMFSNPRKIVNGGRFGVPAGQVGAADASRRLNETRRGVAAFRAAVP